MRLMAFSVLAFLLLASSIAEANDRRCSARSLAGEWGFTVTGARVGVGDVAGVGVFKLTRDGSIVEGRQTVSLGGVVVPETFTGTFTIGDDCTGAAHVAIASPAAPRGASFFVVVTDNSQTIRMVFTDQGTISTIEGRRIHR